jgi:hypothetical protein
MNALSNRTLAEISPETIAALQRQAHLERSRALRAALLAASAWVRGVVREAGRAARLSEAPRPYPSARTCR